MPSCTWKLLASWPSVRVNELQAQRLGRGQGLRGPYRPAGQVVVLDEPTRGVDVGAKRDIYFLVQRLAREGLAVVVISSELMELIGLCHRVAVMRGGQLQTVLEEHQLTEQELIRHATGSH